MTAAPPACATHPERTAKFRCDGCEALLCGECIQEGHRLLFCRLCGERALPLDAEASATSTGRRREASRATAAAYSYREALLYPFRGIGGYAYWGLLGLLLIFEPISRLLPFGGCFVVLPQVLIALVLPGFLFRIAETTAQGADELPDWPELSFWENLGDIFLFVLIGVVSQLPMVVCLFALRCDLDSIFLGQASVGGCIVALTLGFFATVAVWLPSFGSSAVYATWWLFFRLDLHLRAALVDPAEYLVGVLLVGALVVAGAVVPMVLVFLPVPAMIWSFLGDAVVAYALFVAAHLAGVYFRRHPTELDRVYVG